MEHYIGSKVAVGIVMIDSEGYDAMQVIHGVIKRGDFGLHLAVKGESPMEMSEKWLAKLKPVEESLGEEFAGAEYCLIIANLAK